MRAKFFFSNLYTQRYHYCFYFLQSSFIFPAKAVNYLIAVVVQLLTHVQFFATPWTVAHQAPLSMAFSGKNARVSCHFLLEGILLDQGSNPLLQHWQLDSLPMSHCCCCCC